jgi:outer membrane lipoprotein-sorting protein
MKKWIWAPAIAAPIVIIAGALAVPLAAQAAPDLPDKTPAQVLELIASSSTTAYSGDVTVTSDLGLPSTSSIPAPHSTSGASSSSGISDIIALLTGSHDLRVYRDGADVRVQLLDTLAEKDVVATPGSVWVYDSGKNTALHLTGEHALAAAPEKSASPDQLATAIVDALSPSSTLTVDTAQRVAGRDAYTLVLTPKTSDTLVGDVSIAVDARTGLPLSVEATARGANDPALAVEFTSINYSTPAASLFDFTAPKDATVTEKAAPTAGAGTTASAPGLDGLPRPTLTGTGWAAIATLSVGDLGELTSSPLFAQLATRTDYGWLLHTTLVNVLLTDDGRVLAGSVSASALESAAQ